MATENLEKQIDFLALLIIFLIISLFGYNLYSQPTKKNKRLLPRPVTGESTAGEELREQRTADTWRKEGARKCAGPT
jgi:hypothetical protein